MKIKILAGCLVALLIMPCTLSAQKKSKSWVSNGTTLTYEISVRNKQYNFIITNLVMDKDYKLDFEMTEPNAMKGSILIGQQALDTATSQQNSFQPGDNTMMDRSTIWVSKKVYTALKKKKPIYINTGSGRSLLSFKEKQDYIFTLNGTEKSVKVLFAETGSAEKFWILDDKNNPLILKMNLGWYVILKEAKN